MKNIRREITVREAMALSGYSRQQVYNIVVNGRVAARKEGHEYRLDRRALERYVRRQRSQAAG